MAAEDLISEFSKNAVDRHLVDVFLARMESGEQYTKKQCTDILLPLAERNRVEMKRLLGEDIAAKVPVPDCNAFSGSDLVGGAGKLKVSDLRIVEGAGEGHRARTDLCAAAINILVGAAIHGKNMVCREDVSPPPPNDHSCRALENMLDLPIGPLLDDEQYSIGYVKSAMCSLLPHEQHMVAALRVMTTRGEPVKCGYAGDTPQRCPAAISAYLAGACTAAEALADTEKELVLEESLRDAIGAFYKRKPDNLLKELA